MKRIKEVTYRNCCQYGDLKPTKNSQKLKGSIYDIVKCIHCKQLHEYYSYTNAAGSTDWDYRPIKK